MKLFDKLLHLGPGYTCLKKQHNKQTVDCRVADRWYFKPTLCLKNINQFYLSERTSKPFNHISISKINNAWVCLVADNNFLILQLIFLIKIIAFIYHIRYKIHK